MSHTFHLHIVTPTSSNDMGEVEYLRAPGENGLFGVQAGHAPALISLKIGELKVVKEGQETFWATSGGYAEINGKDVQLLLETVESASDVDKERANESKRRAEERLKNKSMDSTRARTSLLRAITRLNVAQR